MASNYLSVELTRPRPVRQITDVRIGTVTAEGVRECETFAVIA
jgi:hypothetical protein